jgi:hypothetical protein
VLGKDVQTKFEEIILDRTKIPQTIDFGSLLLNNEPRWLSHVNLLKNAIEKYILDI